MKCKSTITIGDATLYTGDCIEVLQTIPAESVQTCITSPPYWGLRDYGTAGQLGLEHTPVEYTAKMVKVFREVCRVLKNDGTLWLNLGDSYAANHGSGSVQPVGGTVQRRESGGRPGYRPGVGPAAGPLRGGSGGGIESA